MTFAASELYPFPLSEMSVFETALVVISIVQPSLNNNHQELHIRME